MLFRSIKELSELLDTDSITSQYSESDDFPIKLVFNKPLENAFIYYEDEQDSIRIQWIDQVGEDPEDSDYWQAEEWFTEDYCEGPGQVLYVHADGSIAPCCGYANESEKLKIGSIYTMTIKQVLDNANSMDIIKTIYKYGLLKEAMKLDKEKLPGKGKTCNNCQFCSYLLR